ncbi:uncharacterized protein [Eurosta solidaginis]|uniref:uncharacterized protein isoform X2 n=1 Tax=Eurosta solidaginis TaxID=178769 RepID=UPI00353163AE
MKIVFQSDRFEHSVDEISKKMDFNSTFLSTGDNQVTKQDLDNLNRNINALDKNIDEWRTNLSKENQSTQKLLKRVLEEVKLGASSATVKRKKILPQKPFSEVHEFSEFEAKIQSSENKYNDLVAELQTIICASTTKFIKMAWRKIITDNVAQSYSWQGTKTKTPARALSVTGALKQTFCLKFPNVANDSDNQLLPTR